ncbi:MAG: class I SAM-dependent methyltransferase [Desulfobacteraceae bacterium]|nr:class I SAM-dependent methyltransferase [Desulfobacteraceae bacterium]
MYQESVVIRADLIRDEEKIPVHATAISRYSLLIRFLDGTRFNDGGKFSKLVIQTGGENFELGPCRVISEPNIDGYAGRLVFLKDVYDVESLLFSNKIVKLQNAFLNLPLVLAYKNEIMQPFREYTANLTYDLSVYKNLFDALDSEISEEAENIKESVQKAIIDTEGKKFMRFLDDSLKELERIVGPFNREEHARHGFYFRKQLWSFILCSPLLKRTNLKPRGYAGDSEMMRMIYSNDYQSDSTFSKLMHKHPLEHSAAQAVRIRRRITAKMVRDARRTCPTVPQEKLKILSVACGPAVEIQDILLSAEDCEKYHFILLDQDRHALFEAAELVDQIERTLGTKINVDYQNGSVRTMLATLQLKGTWGKFHFVYAMGLFDYLTPRVASAVLGTLYQLLKPGGEILAGNFHVSNPSKYYMEYWADWVLYHRTEEELRNMLRDAPSAKIDVFFEDTGSQMFLHIKKAE